MHLDVGFCEIRSSHSLVKLPTVDKYSLYQMTAIVNDPCVKIV